MWGMLCLSVDECVGGGWLSACVGVECVRGVIGCACVGEELHGFECMCMCGGWLGMCVWGVVGYVCRG